MGGSRCRKKEELNKGSWTSEEDNLLLSYIQQHGHGCWQSLPAKAGLKRCGKSCRLRWNNYLRPDIKRGKFSLKEQQIIIQLHAFLGNKWSVIASHLPERTDNDIKNYWNTQLKKKLQKLGFDPITHKPISTASPKLTHISQWETARLQAEARLARQLKLQSLHLPFPDPPATAAYPSCRPKCLDILNARRTMDLGLDSPTSTLNLPQTSIAFQGNYNNGEVSANDTIIKQQQIDQVLDAKEIINISLNGPNDNNSWMMDCFWAGNGNECASVMQSDHTVDDSGNGNYYDSLLSSVEVCFPPAAVSPYLLS